MKVDLRDEATESHLSLIGKWIGPYKIQAELGAGGMGAVYLAEQFEPVRRQVALKVIKAGMDSEDVLARFQSERELLARMSHPNIAQVLDVGATPEGRLYFAMEYVPGVPVNEFCDRRGMDIAHRLELFLQICEGVQHAHQKGVIHRDIKPSNLMVADYQGQLLVKVIDFGIAKSMDAHGRGDTGSTRVGVPIGTPAYMSPEQAAGDLAAIDTRTDVYSLGVVLYRMITHDLPISADTIAKAIDSDLARVLREATIRPPSRKVLEIAKDAKVNQADWKRAMASDAPALSRTLKGDLDWITLKALERERDQRYASVSELAADVRRYLDGEVVLAGPPSKLYRARKFVARNKLAVGAAAAVVLSLILGIIGTSYMTIEAQQQRARAEAALKDAQQQRDRAEAESARAIATRSFLEEMIAAPDPWKLQGGSPETRNVRVVEALQTAAANLEKGLADNPALRGEIATMLGRTLRRLGQLDAAREQLDAAVADLGKVDAAQAGPRMRAELERALLLSEQGEHAEAKKVFDQLLPGISAIDGLPAETIDEVRRAAANSLAALGEGDAAEALARENLQRAISGDGEFSAAASGAKAALADVLGERGSWDEAERLITDAYNTERQRLGQAHPSVLQLLANSATLAFRRADFVLAEQRYREAAQSAEQVLGREHPETLRAWAHVAVALANSGKNKEAIVLFDELIGPRTALLGPDHPDVLMMRMNYGVSLRAVGRSAEAERDLDDVYQRRRRVLGETHPETLRVLGVLGVMAIDAKNYGRATTLLRQASELYERANGPTHPESIVIRNNYLAALRDSGEPQAAAESYASLLKVAQAAFPEGNVTIGAIQGNYGLALVELKRFAEAEPLLIDSFRIIRKVLPENDPRNDVPKHRLERLYREWGKPERLSEALRP
ncbi:MAG: tetratricopeptide repeat protein [Xanthomonadales bacterium]|nr:tetratricopeptide repeat protein [Xanthomonadales bacterium]MBP6077259.1 tetratricopeptide repeat protein [Xanthomonadales bacterium]MBP7623332.1 tetratricopeptide repeat protein [Xanthomonadales bacterium]